MLNDKEIVIEVTGNHEELVETASTLGVKAFICDDQKFPARFRKSSKIYRILQDSSEITGPGGSSERTSEFHYEDILVESRVSSSRDLEKLSLAAKLGANKLLVECGDWKVIPLENIIASLHKENCQIYARAASPEEIENLFGVLERGVDGVVLVPKTRQELILSLENLTYPRRLRLEEAEIVGVEKVGIGDRACVDTASILATGEGILVGSASNFFFLMHNESAGSEFTSPRPFRVNAGAIHCYSLMPNLKTKYLSELKSGDRILVTNNTGDTRLTVVGRVKIEKRPVLIVRAKTMEREASIIVQDAETIQFVSSSGEPISVSRLRSGDKVLVHLTEKVGRHFGTEVEEFILER